MPAAACITSTTSPACWRLANGDPPRWATVVPQGSTCRRSVPHWETWAEIAQEHVFVRSDAELKRARAAAKGAGVRAVELSEKVEVEDGAVAISTKHFAKGLEFRSVVVMACDDEVIPQSERIESVADDADLEEVYNTERHLLYVACTRARDHLLVTGVTPVSEFVDDFLKGN